MNDLKKGSRFIGTLFGSYYFFYRFQLKTLFITDFNNQEFQIMRVLHAPDNRVVA